MPKPRRSSSDFYNGIERKEKAHLRWRFALAAKEKGNSDFARACLRAVCGEAGLWWAAGEEGNGKHVYLWGALSPASDHRRTAYHALEKACKAQCPHPCISVLECPEGFDPAPSVGWDREMWKIARKTVFSGIAAAAVARFDGRVPFIALFHDAGKSAQDIAEAIGGGGTGIGDIEGFVEGATL